MKVIISIISSTGDNYIDFKKVWIDNINNVKKNKDIRSKVDFYFLNSEENQKPRVVKYDNYYEFFDEYTEHVRQRRVLKKSLE